MSTYVTFSVITLVACHLGLPQDLVSKVAFYWATDSGIGLRPAPSVQLSGRFLRSATIKAAKLKESIVAIICAMTSMRPCMDLRASNLHGSTRVKFAWIYAFQIGMDSRA